MRRAQTSVLKCRRAARRTSRVNLGQASRKLAAATAWSGLILCLGRPAAAGPSETERTVPILFAVDESFSRDPRWNEHVRRAVAETRHSFRGELGIRFTVAGMRGWQPRAGGSIEDFLDQLRRQVAPKVGVIVAGLTSHWPEPRHVYGIAAYREALLVLSVPTPSSNWSLALGHELAHLFGALHLDAEGGLMCCRKPSYRLDPLNARLVRLHRRRRFAPHLFPLAPADLEQAFEAYLQLPPKTEREAAALLAELAISRGDCARGLVAAERLDPRKVSRHNLRGVALRRLGRHHEAASAFGEALRLRPGNPAALVNLASAYLALGRLGLAEAACQKALSAEPAMPAALATLGSLHVARGETDLGLKLQQRAVGLAPEDPGMVARLADLHLQLGERELARRAYVRVVDLNPEDAVSHNNLAVLLFRQGELALAREHVERTLELGRRPRRAFLKALDDAEREAADAVTVAFAPLAHHGSVPPR